MVENIEVTMDLRREFIAPREANTIANGITHPPHPPPQPPPHPLPHPLLLPPEESLGLSNRKVRSTAKGSALKPKTAASRATSWPCEPRSSFPARRFSRMNKPRN